MSAKKTTKATKTKGAATKTAKAKATKTSKAAKATKPEAAPEVTTAATTSEAEAVPTAELEAAPVTAPEVEARTCTNCGATEFDEDGDCAKCHEPAPKPEAAKRSRKKASTNGEAKTKKLSAIDAAAQVLTETKQPMNTREMIAAMTEKNLWTSPSGKTPHATLYSAILREINVKGKDARFAKTERGKFATNA